ncbi:hypothetical protein CRYUN_Cryun09bG0094600 [Craigia yunnanensis]
MSKLCSRTKGAYDVAAKAGLFQAKNCGENFEVQEDLVLVGFIKTWSKEWLGNQMEAYSAIAFGPKTCNLSF